MRNDPDPAMSDGSYHGSFGDWAPTKPWLMGGSITVPLGPTKSDPENQVSLSILIVSYQPSGHL